MRRDRRLARAAGRWLPVVLVLGLIAAGFAAHRFEWGPRYLGWYGEEPTTDPAAVAPPVGLELPAWSAPAPLVVPATAGPGIDAAAVDAALSRGLGDKTLGRHVVAGVGDLHGQGAVWTLGTGRFIPASTTKVLTAAAALAAVGPDTRFTTRVVQGASPRDLVLVGGGDPYLASSPILDEDLATTYPERADITTLARLAAEHLEGQVAGRRPVRVTYDDSLFTGPADNPKWRADYVPDDIVTPITSLWVDRGVEPDRFGRSDDPARAAAAAFVAALREAGVRVKGDPAPGATPAGATLVASVESAPVAQIVERLLDVSDNETSEVMARHVGLAVSGDGSFVGGAAGVMSTLQGLGVDTGRDVIHDGSGLSRRNRLSASTLLQVLQVAAASDDLRPLITGLPVAGFTGSLANRFVRPDEEVALGGVRAKTGTLSGVSSLAGLVTGVDGSQMVFVLAADKTGDSREVDVEAALDALGADLAGCACGAVS